MPKQDLDKKIKKVKEIIREAIDRWWPEMGIAFTGRKDSSVMMHLIITTTKKKIPAMFIDHGLHFEETIKNLEELNKLWGLDIRKVADRKLLVKLNNTKDITKKKIILSKLKIKTIDNSIKKYQWKALFTAIRWDEQPARSKEKYFSIRKTHFRVHPILHFTEKDIWDYIKKFNIPYNILYDHGYRSIGARPFTKPVEDEKMKERSGREEEKEKIMKRLRALGYF